MPIVTVPGANHSTVSLSYDLDANALLARYIAGVIKTGLAGGTIDAFDNKSGFAPPLPPGMTGEFVQSKSGATLLPKGYDFVVDAANSAADFRQRRRQRAVLVGSGNLQFFATGGSGSIIGGGGNDMIDIAPTDKGNWLIALGNGNDSIRAFGGGNDTISTGFGPQHRCSLAAATTSSPPPARTPSLAGTGSETIDASRRQRPPDLRQCQQTVLRGRRSGDRLRRHRQRHRIRAATGKDLFEGGSAGNNFLQAGSGPATLFGGGDGDQLYAGGDKAQQLHAASGNETLFGGFASGQRHVLWRLRLRPDFRRLGEEYVRRRHRCRDGHGQPGSKNLFEFMKTHGRRIRAGDRPDRSVPGAYRSVRLWQERGQIRFGPPDDGGWIGHHHAVGQHHGHVPEHWQACRAAISPGMQFLGRRPPRKTRVRARQPTRLAVGRSRPQVGRSFARTAHLMHSDAVHLDGVPHRPACEPRVCLSARALTQKCLALGGRSIWAASRSHNACFRRRTRQRAFDQQFGDRANRPGQRTLHPFDLRVGENAAGRGYRTARRPSAKQLTGLPSYRRDAAERSRLSAMKPLAFGGLIDVVGDGLAQRLDRAGPPRRVAYQMPCDRAHMACETALDRIQQSHHRSTAPARRLEGLSATAVPRSGRSPAHRWPKPSLRSAPRNASAITWADA